jgi:hypothetical protein
VAYFRIALRYWLALAICIAVSHEMMRKTVGKRREIDDLYAESCQSFLQSAI